MTAKLNGKVIAYVEARMRSEMGSMIERHGGVPYSAPVLQEVYLKDSPKVQRLVEEICDGTVEAVVLLTGFGPPGASKPNPPDPSDVLRPVCS